MKTKDSDQFDPAVHFRIGQYNVWCEHCGNVFQPTERTSLWWRAKQRAEKGLLDALMVTGRECGCVQKVPLPDAPYLIFGYDMMCNDFFIVCDSPMDLMKKFKSNNFRGDSVFFRGISHEVERKLEEMIYR